MLCKKCFQESIEKIMAKTISKFKMFSPSDKIIVGLSGGKDSITLLYNLIRIREKWHGTEPITALIIDEGIQDYRDRSIIHAKEFCKQQDIDHVVVSFKEKIGITLDEIIKQKRNEKDYKYACNYCATIRRRLLNDAARELGGDVLALGHNLTDLAETFLMNILYKRLNLIGSQFIFKEENSTLNKFFVRKVSPLMRIPEEEIYIYVNLKNLQYYPSHCPYREQDPIIRKRVLNFIQDCKTYSPEIEFNLLNGFLELSEILYNHYPKDVFHHCNNCGYPSGESKLCTYCSLKLELNG